MAENSPEGKSEIRRVWLDGCFDMVHFGHANQMRQSKENSPEGKSEKRRVWADGCYDMVHFGHANQMRQSKECGDVLVVGVHSDSEITKHKGPPVSTEEERYEMVGEIKWVDEVVIDAPYVTSVETLDKHQCEVAVHGDDITTTANGVDTYEEVKSVNRYVEVKRTIGVSTTDLVNRMLSFVTTDNSSSSTTAPSPYTKKTAFVATTSAIVDFGNGRQPKPTDKVILVVGGFDLLHLGHVRFLKKAKELGDFLIVGLLSDDAIKLRKGANYPIMSLHERVLSVLAYKPTDDVLIGITPEVTAELLDRFNITAVVDGFRDKESSEASQNPDPFKEAKKRGIFHLVDSGNDMTTDRVIKRVLDHKNQYESRNARKEKKEAGIAKNLPSA